jgi:hypothetical protein
MPGRAGPDQKEAIMIRPMMRTAGLAAAALAASLTAPTAGAATPFDGAWSVLIVTQQGECDRAYRYPIRIQNGVVTYGGEASFNVSGRVTGGGAVKVSVSRGSARADGSGRMSGSSGSGSWKGSSSTASCSGTWTAERRG